jgi:L-fuconolactonase
MSGLPCRKRGPEMQIDAHQHFWRLADRVGQWPPVSLGQIHRDFLPHDLLPTLATAGVDGTILVQSRATLADNSFMLELAAQHDFILGVVGWVDLKDSHATMQITRLAQHPKFKGVRPMLQNLPDPDWINDTALTPAIQAMLHHHLSFDALVLPHHLPSLAGFARRNPSLPIVIDHAAKPLIAIGQDEPWQTDLAALAALPNVSCKLSGLLTEAGARTDIEALAPYVNTILNHFGPERVIWGSDWPVLRLAGDYQAWREMAEHLCARWHALHAPAANTFSAMREAIFGANAQRFYRL